MKKLNLLVPCLALSLALALVACGSSSGGGDSTASGGDGTAAGTQDEALIESTIVASVTSDEPSKCTEFITQHFAETISEATGAAAVEECEEEATDTSDDPDQANISQIDVEGSKATALVAFVGGPFDRQTVEVSLVKDEGDWKLDELLGFADLDKEAMASTFEAQFQEASPEITPQQAKCIGDGFRNASGTQIEEVVLGGSESALEEVIAGCE